MRNTIIKRTVYVEKFQIFSDDYRFNILEEHHFSTVPRRPIISNLEIRREWLKESKAHDMSNNISWQEIAGDTVQEILFSICCSVVRLIKILIYLFTKYIIISYQINYSVCT